MRYFLGVHHYAPLDAMSGDVGWYPPEINRHVSLICFCNRLITMENTRITKIIFEKDLTICKKNWSEQLEALLESLDLSHHFYEKTCVNLDEAETKLKEKYLTKWNN